MTIYGPYKSNYITNDAYVAANNGGYYNNTTNTYIGTLDGSNAISSGQVTLILRNSTASNPQLATCGGIIFPAPKDLNGINPTDVSSAYMNFTSNGTWSAPVTSFGFKLVKSPIDTFPTVKQSAGSIYNPYYLYNTYFSSVSPISVNFGGTGWTTNQSKNTENLVTHLRNVLNNEEIEYGVTPLMLLWSGNAASTNDIIQFYSRDTGQDNVRPAFYFESTYNNAVAKNTNDPSGSFVTTFATPLLVDTPVETIIGQGKILEVRCENNFFSPTTFLYTGVSTNGRMTAASPVRVANPFINEAAIFTGDGTKIIMAKNPRFLQNPEYQRREDIGGLRFQDWQGQQLYAGWNFKTWPSEATTSLSTFSSKFYWMAYGERSDAQYPGIFSSYIHGDNGASASGLAGPLFQPIPVVYFRENGVTKFQVLLEGYRYVPASNTWTSLQPYIANASGQTYTTISRFSADRVMNNKTWRFEVQVQPTEPKVTIRIYDWDSEVPFETLTANPSNVACDEITFGHLTAGQAYYSGIFVNDIEVHDNYDISGTVGKHYELPTPHWHKYQNGYESALGQDGEIENGSLIDVIVTDFEREMVFDSYTTFQLDYDGPSRAYRNLDLHVPDGTPPAGGWPTIVWCHGGFFVGGDKYDLPDGFKKYLLSNGFAVATISYILGTALIGAPSIAGLDLPVFPIPKPTWPNAGAGEFPSFIIDFKKAAKYLQSNAGTYNLNASKFIASGFSAGGYIALASAVSKDLDDYNGYNLTLTNATYGGSPSESDPDFIGAYVYAAPISIQLIWDYDPTHPYFGFVFDDLPDDPNTREGRLRTTARAFMGDTYKSNPDFTGTSIPEMIVANAANCPPIGYMQGRSDYLVHWEHPDLLEAECLNSNIAFTKHTDATYHDLANVQFGKGHLINFLRDVTT